MTLPSKIGAVSYLNTRPLIRALNGLLPEMELELDLPSRLATRLQQREFAVALVPVVELFSGPDYRVVSDACIACDGPVWSVKLLSRLPPEKIRSVALDEGSRTSVCLARLVMRHFWNISTTETILSISDDWTRSNSDAVLIIGDRAMSDFANPQDCGGYCYQWDLGELWKKWTGLPFVFAVWAAHPDAPLDRLDRALQLARDAGVAAATEIAAASAGEFGLTQEQCLTYLTRHLRFTLGASQRAGLELFARLATTNGLIRENPEIQYHAFTPA